MALVVIVNLAGGEGSDRILSIYTLPFGIACCSVMLLRENQKSLVLTNAHSSSCRNRTD